MKGLKGVSRAYLERILRVLSEDFPGKGFEDLRKKYREKGRFTFKDVDGALFGFSRRNYNGHPEKFFSDFSWLYNSLGRTELYRFDQPLYRALARCNKLEKIIPGADEEEVERGRRLGRKNKIDYSKKDIKIMKDAYKTYNISVTRAARHLPYSEYSLRKVWKESGYPARPCGCDLFPNEVKEIVKGHKRFNGNVSEAARNMPYSGYRISKYWKLAGLRVGGVDETVARKINEMYEECQGNSSEVERRLRNTRYRRTIATILKHWRRAGYEIRPKGLPLSEAKKIREAYETFKGNALAAERALNHEKRTIERHWRKEGLID